MSALPQKLTAKQERAIVALLSEPTQKAAAAKARVNERTLQRWLKDQVFLDAYRVARQRAYEGRLVRLQRISNKAIDTLERNLTCKIPAAEIRAALGVLEQEARSVEQLDLARELEELRNEVQRVRAELEASRSEAASGAGPAGFGEKPAAGEPAPGSGQTDDGFWDDTGPVADGVAAITG